jgi:hypothetical protein
MGQLCSTPKGDIAVRIANPEDADPLFKLRVEALSMHPESFAADIDMTIVNGVEAWMTLIENYDQDQSGTIVIACMGNDLIGMTGVGRGH